MPARSSLSAPAAARASRPIPAIADAAGLARQVVADWTAINRRVPRLVDVLPNGQSNHPTVRVFLAGGVPEVMLHLRRMGLLDLDALTVTGEPLGAGLDAWEHSHRRGPPPPLPRRRARREPPPRTPPPR